MTHIHFEQPPWLWIGALCCAATAGLLARAGRLRRRASARLAGPRFATSVNAGGRLTKQALLLVGLAAAFAALARPLAGFRWDEQRHEGIDLMFAVDTSKSMRASDLRPDRLTRAKLAVSDLLRKFPGERVGLIAFAGDAFVQAPMTIDQAVFAEALDALDTDIIPRGGTDIASPIRAAVEAMATEPGRRKLLVILSDGEDLQGEALVAAKEAARAGLVIYTVGVGTPAGELIPVEHDGLRDVIRDADGQAVRSRLDEQTLRRLAQTTGGAYAPLGQSGQGLETLYREHLAQLPRRTVEERMHKVYTERFQIPLAVAIGCLLLELALGERRRRRVARATSQGQEKQSDVPFSRSPAWASAGVSGVALALLMATASRSALAAPDPAASPGISTGVSTYNDGTAAYRKKDFPAARDRFQDATHTTDIALQENAYYDLGNARYRLGQKSVPQDRHAAIEAWKSAIVAYDGALALRPTDADARFNRDLVARRVAALEEEDKKPRDQKQDQQKQHEPNQQNQKDQEKQKEQQTQPQSSSGQGQKDQKDQSSPQSGKGQPQQRQGSSPDSKGQQAKAPQGTEKQGPASTQDQGKESEGEGPQSGTASGQPQANKRPQQGRADQDSANGQTGTPPDQSPDTRQSPRPDQEPSAVPPAGPGVVSGQPSQHTGGEHPAAARRDPGALSASEAVHLLDSVSGELRRMPVANAHRRQPNNTDSPTKDW